MIDKCHAAEYGRARLADEETRYSEYLKLSFLCLFTFNLSFFKQKLKVIFDSESLKWYMPNFPPMVMHL